MRRRLAGFKAAALVDRHVYQHRARLHALQVLAADEPQKLIDGRGPDRLTGDLQVLPREMIRRLLADIVVTVLQERVHQVAVCGMQLYAVHAGFEGALRAFPERGLTAENSFL